MKKPVQISAMTIADYIKAPLDETQMAINHKKHQQSLILIVAGGTLPFLAFIIFINTGKLPLGDTVTLYLASLAVFSLGALASITVLEKISYFNTFKILDKTFKVGRGVFRECQLDDKAEMASTEQIDALKASVEKMGRPYYVIDKHIIHYLQHKQDNLIKENLSTRELLRQFFRIR